MPSALFTPLSEPAGDQLLHLDGVAGGWICGLHARTRAGEIATRAVTSAKSWLSYAGVDRRANVLPYRLAGDPAEDGDDDEVPRLSPLDAAMLVLRQVQRAWDAAHPEHPLSKQDVILTVPASFDAVARTLTVEAAQRIGMAVRLLEAPQAAFYERMRQQGDALFATALGEADEARVLVCDVDDERAIDPLHVELIGFDEGAALRPGQWRGHLNAERIGSYHQATP